MERETLPQKNLPWKKDIFFCLGGKRRNDLGAGDILQEFTSVNHQNFKSSLLNQRLHAPFVRKFHTAFFFVSLKVVSRSLFLKAANMKKRGFLMLQKRVLEVPSFDDGNFKNNSPAGLTRTQVCLQFLCSKFHQTPRNKVLLFYGLSHQAGQGHWE